jgi:hypothetical protein
LRARAHAWHDASIIGAANALIPLPARSIPACDYPVRVSHRRLVLVSGLTLGDYLLWNWSLSGGHDVLAIVSGLSLVPLVLITASLLAVTTARALARTPLPPVRRRRRPTAPGATAPAHPASSYVRALHPDGLYDSDLAAEISRVPSTTSSSGKIAA